MARGVSGKRVIVIDGPAGAGKSTAARALAEQLGGTYLDTGAMFRAFTLRALRLGVDLADEDALVRVVDGGRLEVHPEDGGTRVVLDGEDVSAAIRTREVTAAIRHLAECAPVRARLASLQRDFAAAAPGDVVAEGRDLGSVVFPDAAVKVYLDASVEERARRRAADLGPAAPPAAALAAEIAERDRRDSTRAVAPLVRCPDAVYVDTSGLAFDAVLERLLDVVARG